MHLIVPEQQVPHIKWLLELPDEKLEAFLSVLDRTSPHFNVYDLSDEFQVLQLPQYRVVEILRVLGSLYLTRKVKEPLEKFVDEEVYGALNNVHTFAPEKAQAQWEKLRKFLLAALSFERSLGTTTKAGDILTRHERVFQSARIMTDMRPIFHVDVKEKPDGALVIHMLKITQRDGLGNQKDFYFALDRNDMTTLMDMIQRGLEKETTIRKMMAESGVTILDPKEYY
jgi:hypothetical protein